MLFQQPIAPFKSSLHGNGIIATTSFKEGERVFSEIPRYTQQTVENRNYAFTCGFCFSFLGSYREQIGFLTGMLRRSSLCSSFSSHNASFCVPCGALCGEFYCSDICRDSHWNSGYHSLLCTGSIRDEEAEDHPLMKFKIHAINTNEIFLLVADVLASIIGEGERIAAVHGELPVNNALQLAISPLGEYVRQLWWDAAIAPSDQKPTRFANVLRKLVKRSPRINDHASKLWTLLFRWMKRGPFWILYWECRGKAWLMFLTKS